MRLYMASRYSRYPEIEAYALEARALGHEVTSRWHSGSHDLDGQSTSEDRKRLALEDLGDMQEARDGIVVFTNGPSATSRGRGGHHVETGYVMGMGRDVYIVGPRLNVFHYLRRVTQFDTWEEFKGRVLDTPARGEAQMDKRAWIEEANRNLVALQLVERERDALMERVAELEEALADRISAVAALQGRLIALENHIIKHVC